MKKYIFNIIVMFSLGLCAQVSIDKASNNIDGGGLLDFRAEASDLTTTPNKGLILPKVDSLDNASVAGTIYFNSSNGQVEYLDNNKTIIPMTPGNTNISPLDNSLDDLGEGMIIADGSSTSSAPGVLVLESSTKSLILPKVTNPETSIENPSPGMIVYDLSSDTMAVYNGESWSFWY